MTESPVILALKLAASTVESAINLAPSKRSAVLSEMRHRGRKQPRAIHAPPQPRKCSIGQGNGLAERLV